jgi:hypothetical protein
MPKAEKLAARVLGIAVWIFVWSLGFGASDALRPLRREFLNCIEALLIP